MFELRKTKNEDCEQFLEELELLPAEKITASEYLRRMSLEARKHAQLCAGCDEAVREVVEARWALQPLILATRGQEEPTGPWFVSRVMAVIAAKEREVEEHNSVWINVRRLAPRLVAISALLLMLGGTWALQLSQSDRSVSMRPAAEGLFEAFPAYNDDLMTGEARP
jgi:hypothetical protein